MSKTILIVEDDPFIAMDLQDTFEDAGFAVLGPAANVQSGLNLIREARPDVAMLDFNLGRETSVPIAEVLDELNIPYVFASGQTEDVVLAERETAARVFRKPFNPDRAVGILNTILDKANKNKFAST